MECNPKEIPLVNASDQHVRLSSPTAMPNASAFLWNRNMMIQVNCRGYATAQFMQPEPSKYAHAPNLQAQSFMQPEQPFYAHHPGRFFYIKDEISGAIFSVPYEPMRSEFDEFNFIVEPAMIRWNLKKLDLVIELSLNLAVDKAVELWEISIENQSDQLRKLSVYSYFPIGYMSWMNQSANYDEELRALIAKSITPYQKYQDYFKQRDFKDQTYLLTNITPDSWEARQEAFEGEGGLTTPSSIKEQTLSNSCADYELPTAVMQHRLVLKPKLVESIKFVFGPAKDRQEISEIRSDFILNKQAFKENQSETQRYLRQAQGSLTIDTPDKDLNDFVNQWLPRQMFYHGDVNRLCTDPQTRNYLQDNMGLSYIHPKKARQAFLFALAQQNKNGAMPDGVLLNDTAELKYINQVPHVDHCVWLPICISAYLEETNDYQFLQEPVLFADSEEAATVFEHICLAMDYLLGRRDKRGLSFIEQGDWCDPMNMVGYKGRGVSTWLSLATAYALQNWADICQTVESYELAKKFRKYAKELNYAVNKHCWHKAWYARGITDDDKLFGVEHDPEGRIFLNPQSWAILCGAADQSRFDTIVEAIERQLETPFGVAMLAPAFTKMREDIGRVTQKFPGSAENGSVYNHAATFYVYALYSIGESDRAFKLLRQMLPGPDQDDLRQRGQLPVFIPNYYRGAFYQYPRTAGRSSQLFNTGSVHWFYRCLVDGLFGVQGDGVKLRIDPKLPSHWQQASLVRYFRQACFNIDIKRSEACKQTELFLDGVLQEDLSITDFEAGENYRVSITIPC
ncbi:MAG: hypothetical protein KTR16_17180 [Acidiferrobacterales bacterium]|nr:hypothetical protein [Acidiferrobacterales bacterium]